MKIRICKREYPINPTKNKINLRSVRENENENLQKSGSNHSGEKEYRSEEESDSLSPMMERLLIEIKLEKMCHRRKSHVESVTKESSPCDSETHGLGKT